MWLSLKAFQESACRHLLASISTVRSFQLELFMKNFRVFKTKASHEIYVLEEFLRNNSSLCVDRVTGIISGRNEFPKLPGMISTYTHPIYSIRATGNIFSTIRPVYRPYAN